MSWCEHCHNTGSLDCYCGGDLCVCENYGEYPCPYCEGNDFACEEIDGQECPRCGGSDDVCSECGGQKVFPRKQKVDAE